MASKKKSVFYFEDDLDGLQDYVRELRKSFEVTLSAQSSTIEQERDEKKVDIVVVDLMIHTYSVDPVTHEEVENVYFEGVNHTRSGLEFLRRIRSGEYEKWGIPREVPAIVATAVVNDLVRAEAFQLRISAYLEKPFTIDELEEAVRKALGG